MPILPKCQNCGRLGGYTEKDSDKICLRCKKLAKPKTKTIEDENEE